MKSIHATQTLNDFTKKKIATLEEDIQARDATLKDLEEKRDEQKELFENTSFVEQDRTKAILSCSKSRERKHSADNSTKAGGSANVANKMKTQPTISPKTALAPLQFDRASAEAAPARRDLSPPLNKAGSKAATIQQDKENAPKADLNCLRKFLVGSKRQEPEVVNSGDELDRLTMDGDVTTLEKQQSVDKKNRASANIRSYIEAGPKIVVSSRDHLSKYNKAKSDRAMDMPRQCRLKFPGMSKEVSARISHRDMPAYEEPQQQDTHDAKMLET